MVTAADIIAFRELYQLTRKELANLMCVSRRAIDYWEEGKVKISESRAEQFLELERKYSKPQTQEAASSMVKETITPEQILNIRVARNWSRGQLGNAVGASRSSIDYWERGIHQPSPIYIKKLNKLVAKISTPTASTENAMPRTSEAPAIELFEAAAEFRDYRRKSVLRDGLDFAKAKGNTFENKVELFLAIVLDQAPSITLKELLETIKS